VPTYDYGCKNCGNVMEVIHRMDEKPRIKCPECGKRMGMQFSSTFNVMMNIKGTVEDYREREHKKKVKDPERAVRMRKKMFGKEAVGDPCMKSDPKKVIKKKIIKEGGATVDKKDFIKKAARKEGVVRQAQEVLKRQRS